MQKDWFASWFNSPYYHLLYAHRDENEAEFFLSCLVDYLKIKEKATILDLACGKGRHAVFLNKLGFKVTGVDLSPNNISEASKNIQPDLAFKVGDMREKAGEESFDYIFNLFTSFGYFEEDTENQKVLEAVNEMLSPRGIFVLDFFNATKLMNDLCVEESKREGDILFHIHKINKNGVIEKRIEFDHLGIHHSYCEKVRLLHFSDLQKMLNATQLQIIATFGSYSLSPFDENTSDRLIIIAQKK